MNWLWKLIFGERHDVASIVAPIGKIIEKLEAAAGAHERNADTHSADAKDLQLRAVWALDESQKAKNIAAKIGALIG